MITVGSVMETMFVSGREYLISGGFFNIAFMEITPKDMFVTEYIHDVNANDLRSFEDLLFVLTKDITFQVYRVTPKENRGIAIEKILIMEQAFFYYNRNGIDVFRLNQNICVMGTSDKYSMEQLALEPINCEQTEVPSTSL